MDIYFCILEKMTIFAEKYCSTIEANMISGII
jgi:hypothetical protein